MDWRQMPPLPALRAFSAYAETGSVQSAGDALNVSHAAISQQIRNLEAHMHLKLLDRSGRQAQLTSEGQALADALAEGFGRIATQVAVLTGAEEDRALHISTTPSFAGGWLMPRLADWRAAHPEIDLMIDANPALRDPSPGGIDVALRFGAGQWDGLETEMLLPTAVGVVAAPSLLEGVDLSDTEALGALPWLREQGVSETSQWFNSAKLPCCVSGGLMELPGHMLLDALLKGQGMAVIALTWIADDIAAGRLVVVHRDLEDQGYHIVTKPGVHRPALKAFLKWLRRAKKAAD